MSASDVPITYKVFVQDNFHFYEDDDLTLLGEYGTYEDALAAAKTLVEESVAANGFDYRQYTSFGDGAFVVPSREGERFSAWEYAESLCRHRQAE